MIQPDVIGCDVAKAHLDFFDSGLGRHYRIDNTPAAIAAWRDTLEGRSVHVVLEATGRYDRQLRAALDAGQLPYWRVNPARARDFANAIGLLAKTNAIDARLLARMGQSLPVATEPSADPVRHALARLHTRRDQLVAMRQQERTRLHEAEGSERDSLESHIAWLDHEIASTAQACRQQLLASETLQEEELRLRSIPGIGPIAALTLISHMPAAAVRPRRWRRLPVLRPSMPTAAACADSATFGADESAFATPSTWPHSRPAV